MKKVWGYIAAILLGFIGGMIVMFQMAKKSISNTSIKGKVKQKNTTGSLQDVSTSISKKEQRKHNREIKKLEKALK